MFSAARPWWTGRKNSKPKISLSFVVEPGVGRAARVAVVGDHHGGELQVAHRVDAAVSEHVQEHVAVLQQEGVVAGVCHGLLPVLDGRKVELLDDAHLVHFERRVLTAEELHLRHADASTVDEYVYSR